MHYLCWKTVFTTVAFVTLLDTCAAQYRNSPYGVREVDHHKKPYEFNDAEMTAIQAIMAFRDVISELLSKVGIPGLASIITRSDLNQVKNPVRVAEPLESTGIKSGGLGSAILRGVTLSLPLLVPLVSTQIRRMSVDPPYIPPVPFLPDPYYDRALHRRRGRRSISRVNAVNELKQLETILRQIEELRLRYNSK